jgi:LmbE family N-acetylglucosaminyl deacetylase
MENALEYPIPQRAMSIQAHPDDQEFTIAGTLAKWIRSGTYVASVIITSGESGCNEPDKDGLYKPTFAEQREREQLAANAVLGIQETVFLRYPDGTLQNTLELRRDLARQIRRYKPEVVFCGDPTARFYGTTYINHPDHRAAADAACDAVFPSAGTRLIFPELLTEGLEPHNVKRVYIWGAQEYTTWVDISETIVLKVQALRQHRSQIGDWDSDEGVHRSAAERGKDHGIAYAEAFKVMDLENHKE